MDEKLIETLNERCLDGDGMNCNMTSEEQLWAEGYGKGFSKGIEKANEFINTKVIDDVREWLKADSPFNHLDIEELKKKIKNSLLYYIMLGGMEEKNNNQ